MIRRRLARASRKDMGGDSLGDGPYGIALIYRADCNLNQAHGAQSAAWAAWAARVAEYERFGVPTYWIVNPDPPEPELTGQFGLLRSSVEIVHVMSFGRGGQFLA